jgi:hypothetical protein
LKSVFVEPARCRDHPGHIGDVDAQMDGVPLQGDAQSIVEIFGQGAVYGE